MCFLKHRRASLSLWWCPLSAWLLHEMKDLINTGLRWWLRLNLPCVIWIRRNSGGGRSDLVGLNMSKCDGEEEGWKGGEGYTWALKARARRAGGFSATDQSASGWSVTCFRPTVMQPPTLPGLSAAGNRGLNIILSSTMSSTCPPPNDLCLSAEMHHYLTYSMFLALSACVHLQVRAFSVQQEPRWHVRTVFSVS